MLSQMLFLAQALSQVLIVLDQLGQHRVRLDVIRVVIEHSRSYGDLADRMQSKCANFSHSFRCRIDHYDKAGAVRRGAGGNRESEGHSYAPGSFSSSRTARRRPSEASSLRLRRREWLPVSDRSAFPMLRAVDTNALICSVTQTYLRWCRPVIWLTACSKDMAVTAAPLSGIWKIF